MLRQQKRRVTEQDAVVAKRKGAARFDQPQCFGCFPRQLCFVDDTQRGGPGNPDSRLGGIAGY